MTDVHILKGRRRRRTLARATMLLAVGVAVWGCDRRDADLARSDEAAGNAGTSATASDAVREYIQFADMTKDVGKPDPGGEGQYLADGLRKLAGALGTLGVGSPDLTVDLRVAAEHILLDPTSPANAATVRPAFISAADAIAAKSAGNGANLRRSAESIAADRSLLDQDMAVREFFRQSANAIQQLSRES